MNAKALIEAARKEFQKALQAKTGWGRNEILNTFDRAVAEALAGLIDVENEEEEHHG